MRVTLEEYEAAKVAFKAAKEEGWLKVSEGRYGPVDDRPEYMHLSTEASVEPEVLLDALALHGAVMVAVPGCGLRAGHHVWDGKTYFTICLALSSEAAAADKEDGE